MTPAAKPAGVSSSHVAHTPGKWRVDSGDKCRIETDSMEVGHDPVWIADTLSLVAPVEISRANAARIVACVNACEGIDEPADYIGRAETTRMALIRQRDELAAALQFMTGLIEGVHNCRGVALEQARAALSKTGEQP